MKFAVIALLGVSVSALDQRRHKKTYQHVKLDDHGFVVLGEKLFIKKESDWLANGDEKDDLEVQSEYDPNDAVVQDNGFGLSAGNWAEHPWTNDQYKGSLRDFVQVDANIHQGQRHRMRHRSKKESDWLANGDEKDDLEVQSEYDPNDAVVQDNGFGLSAGNWMEHPWTNDQYKGSLRDLVQLDSKMESKDLFLTETFKDKHPSGLVNAMAAPLNKAEDTMLLQMDAMQRDHFYTESFKENHPNKVMNAMYQRPEDADIMNLQLEFNEIDNFNPRAQARLAKYEKFM